MQQTRLKKFTRQPELISRRQFTERDYEIIGLVGRYKFLPSSLLLRLIGRSNRVTHRHLQWLYHQAFINRFAFPGIPPSEFHYYLDDLKVLRLLAEHEGSDLPSGLISEVQNNRDKNYAQISDSTVVAEILGHVLFVKHEVMISRFHATLELSCRQSQGKVILEDFRQGPELNNSVDTSQLRINSRTGQLEQTGGTERLPHRPDAFFTLRFTDKPEGEDLSHFFYEADRKTTASPRFQKKLRAHYEFIVRQKKIREIYGIPRIRAVLVETLDMNWGEHLRQSAASPIVSGTVAGSPLFWFTVSPLFMEPVQLKTGRTLPHYLADPSIILGAIWATPVDDTLHRLSE